MADRREPIGYRPGPVPLSRDAEEETGMNPVGQRLKEFRA
jgi:hypothetical protein